MGNKKYKKYKVSSNKKAKTFSRNSIAGRVTFEEFKAKLNFKWVLSGLLIAVIAYYFCFNQANNNFLLSLGLSSIILAGVAVWAGGGLPLFWHNIGTKNIWIGVGSSLVLYMILGFAAVAMQSLFDFVPSEIKAIYGLVEGLSPILLGGVLVIIVGPCLEIFWQGFLQSWATKVMGNIGGWLFTAFCYTAVFILSGNITLILTAAICGLFWGFLYMWKKSLALCVFSHSLWALAILVLYPIIII